MTNVAPDLDAAQRRMARRLARLFRIERAGRFEQRPVAAVRLMERRGALIDALIATLSQRRSGTDLRSPGLEGALADLAFEVRRSRERAKTRLERLHAELRLRRGDMPPSGLRGSGGGKLLGRG